MIQHNYCSPHICVDKDGCPCGKCLEEERQFEEHERKDNGC